MLQLPLPAAGKSGGGAATCGRLLLLAALDASAKQKQGCTPTSPASPAAQSNCGSSAPGSPDGLEHGEGAEAEPDSQNKHVFGWYLVRWALTKLLLFYFAVDNPRQGAALSGIRTPKETGGEEPPLALLQVASALRQCPIILNLS
eukprot:g16864.t1